MTAQTGIHRDKFIAYALIGYLDVVRRTGDGDYHFYRCLGPRRLAEDMAKAGVRNEVISLFEEIDEIESLVRGSGGTVEFEQATTNAIVEVLAMLREPIPYEERQGSPMEALLAG